MSEIPLHTFGRSRKSRAGYTPLHNGDPGDDVHGNGTNGLASSNNNGRNMQAAVRAAVTTSGSVSRKGKRRERYADDPEEEETLLGDASHEDGEFRDDEREEQRREASQVCTVATNILRRAMAVWAPGHSVSLRGHLSSSISGSLKIF